MTGHDQHCYCRRTWPEWLRRNTSLLRCFCFPWPATVTVGGHDLSDCEETHHLVLNLNISFYKPRLSQIPARKSKCKFRYSLYSLLHYLVSILFSDISSAYFQGRCKPIQGQAWALLHSGMPKYCIQECVFYAVFDLMFWNSCFNGEIWYSIDPFQLIWAWIAGCFEILKCLWNWNNQGDTDCTLVFQLVRYWDYLVQMNQVDTLCIWIVPLSNFCVCSSAFK